MLKHVEASWNVLAHSQKPDFVFRRNERVHLNRLRGQLSRLLAAELCASAVVMLDTPCSEVVWRVLATHSIRQFPLHFPSRASPCGITFQLESTIQELAKGMSFPPQDPGLIALWYPSAWAPFNFRWPELSSVISVFSAENFNNDSLRFWICQFVTKITTRRVAVVTQRDRDALTTKCCKSSHAPLLF